MIFTSPKQIDDKCEEIKIKKSQNISSSIEEINLHDLHIAEKLAMREKKNKDKLTTNENCLLVVFDLENEITRPKADVVSFFYKRKLTLYNLTAMTFSKQGYCAIWTKRMSGQARNDIASAFMQILNKVAANVTELICWSDSCAPQNKNSRISIIFNELVNFTILFSNNSFILIIESLFPQKTYKHAVKST